MGVPARFSSSRISAYRAAVVGHVSGLVHRPEEIAGLAAGETRRESCPTGGGYVTVVVKWSTKPVFA